MTKLGIALVVLGSGLQAIAADASATKPQIQGANVRIEFDSRLRSRIVARFDKQETVMGPFTASETVTTAYDAWAGFFSLASQKHERTKDALGEGERLLVEGNAGIADQDVICHDIRRLSCDGVL